MLMVRSIYLNLESQISVWILKYDLVLSMFVDLFIYEIYMNIN